MYLLRQCQVIVAALGIFSCSAGIFSCGLWDLVPWQDWNPDPCIGSMESQPLDHQGSPSSSFLIWIYFVYFPCLIALAKTPVALLHNIIALPLILEDTFLAFHCGVWHYLSAYKMCLDYVVKYSLGAPPTFCVCDGGEGGMLHGL